MKNITFGTDGCRNCKFWETIAEASQHGTPMGECRRYPPYAQMAMTKSGPVNVSVLP